MAILSAGATAPDLGILAALTALPGMFLGPYAGVLADRRGRRPILIAADVLRALCLFTIPWAALTGRLAFPQMLIVATLVSALTVVFRVADQAWLPSFVGRGRLLEGNTFIGAASGIGEFAGPSAMGALIQGLGGPVAILFDGLSYLASAVSLLGVRRREVPREEVPIRRPSATRDALRGVGKVLAHPVLRPLLLVLATQALTNGVFEALYEIYALKSLHLTPFAIGLLVTSGGVGALLAGATLRGLSRRVGVGPLLVATMVLSGATSFLVPLAPGVAVVAFLYLFGAQLFGDYFGTLFEVSERTLRQAQTPDSWLGRVNGSVNLATGLLGAAGALGAGFLAEAIGPRDAFFLAAAADVAVVGFLLGTPIPRLRSVGPPGPEGWSTGPAADSTSGESRSIAPT